MNFKEHFLVIFLIFIFSGVLSLSSAQTIQSDIRSLSKGADVIATGKVVKQKSEWNENKTRIFTEVTVNVGEYLKGSTNNETLVLRTLGGEVGEVGEFYTHMPRFSKDEEVLLFAKKDKKDNTYKVFDGENGKITVYQDKNTGEKVTSSNTKISTLKKEIKKYLEQQ